MSDHCEISGARLTRPGRGESLSMDEAAAFRAGAEAMREAAAAFCEKVALEGFPTYAKARNKMGRGIRALPLPEPPASLTASGWSYRG